MITMYHKWPLPAILLLLLLSFNGCVKEESTPDYAGYYLLSNQGALWQLPPGATAFDLLGGVSGSPTTLTSDNGWNLLTCSQELGCFGVLSHITLTVSCQQTLPAGSQPIALAWAADDLLYWLESGGQQVRGVDLSNGLPLTPFATGTPALAGLTGVTVTEAVANQIVLQPGELLSITAVVSGQAQLYRLRPAGGTSELIGLVPALAPICLLPNAELTGCDTQSEYILSVDLVDLTPDTLAANQPVINPAALTWLEQH